MRVLGYIHPGIRRVVHIYHPGSRRVVHIYHPGYEAWWGIPPGL